jgi:hypothetical protein
LVAGVGFEAEVKEKQEITQEIQTSAKSLQDRTLAGFSTSPPEQKVTASPHSGNTSTQPKCAKCVYENGLPEDLAEVVVAWPGLSPAVKAGILALVNAAK